MGNSFRNRGFSIIYPYLDTNVKNTFTHQKYVIDQDLAARMMFEKGAWVGVNSPFLEKLVTAPVKTLILATEDMVRTHEAKIRDLPYEKCFAFAEDGTIILSKSGAVNRIEISPEEGVRLKGTVFTHNHPGGTSFFMEDIQTGSLLQVREVRATGKYRTYIMGMTDDSNMDSVLWRERGMRAFLQARVEVNEAFSREYTAVRLTETEWGKSYWHEIWNKVSNSIPEYKYKWIDE